MPDTAEIVIHEMREFEAGPEPTEYYARGHHEKHEFYRELLRQYGDIYFTDRLRLKLSRHTDHYIRHEYWRAVPTGLEDCSFTYMRTEPGPGAFPVTVVDA